MAAVSSSVTVGTSATSLGVAQRAASRVVVASPTGGVTVFVGGPGVTTATGIPVAAGSSLALGSGPGEQLFAVVAAATQAVPVLALGL